MKLSTVLLLALGATTTSGFGVGSMQNAIQGGEYIPVSPESVYPQHGPGSNHIPARASVYQPAKTWGSGSYNALYKSMQNDLAAGDYQAIHPRSTYPSYMQNGGRGFYQAYDRRNMEYGPKHGSHQYSISGGEYASVSPESIYPEYGPY